MTELRLHNRRLESIFELLGTKENAITYGIGWALSQSPAFLQNILSGVFVSVPDLGADRICLQEYQKGSGRTDAEILGQNVHLIIEAKRGLWLPGESQLIGYMSRLRESKAQHRALLVMSECSSEYARLHLPEVIEGFPVVYMSWKDVHNLSSTDKGSHSEKRLLLQLRTYLRRLVRMQDQESNMVYVVALSYDTPDWSKIPLVDFVTKKRRYFLPAEGGRSRSPKEPPNYLAFRYDGRLQSIHHVESWKIVEDLHAEVPEIKPVRWPPHFLYTLGDPIIPPKVVKTGKIFGSGRVKVMLDLLLTCDTISEARDLTQKRLAGDA